MVYSLIIAQELGIKQLQVESTLLLKAEGATIPFISRYRKERTGELDETQVRIIFERDDYFKDIIDRKETILNTIEEQGKLTAELRSKIDKCISKSELEDLYLPFKPKKRTKATIAKEKGLEPLATLIKENNIASNHSFDLISSSKSFINPELDINTAEEALAGASDIIAEEVSENSELRSWLREFILKHGNFVSKIKKDIPEGSTKYEMYRDFEAPVSSIKPHSMLALRRAETEKIITLNLSYDDTQVIDFFNKKLNHSPNQLMREFYENLIKDSHTRLLKHSIIGEIRLMKKQEADESSIKVFEDNLRQLLLSPPAGMKPTLGIDPGFRTGCKIVALDHTGKFLEYKQIFPFEKNKESQAKSDIIQMIDAHDISLIAIGNGTAGRETDEFLSKILKDIDRNIIKVIVNESGASIYSASEVAKSEFPDLDLTIRGAISIARRLQDPLAELVKIDPKSIGVGQYQHDVDQKLLKKKLADTVSSCVNHVGVDLNTASKELLMYVSGITATAAKNIIDTRNRNGIFKSRTELMKVKSFGEKTFEQAAGFLRIRDGINPLDCTAVHPESYPIVMSILGKLDVSLEKILNNKEIIENIRLEDFTTDLIGIPTIRDIITELEKPGRDVRQKFQYAKFQEGIKEIQDLKIGMQLEGVVTNIASFGAFVDIGVHQDGLVHISEIADRYVKHPSDVLKVGQLVSAQVISVDLPLKRISLSLKHNKSKDIELLRANKSKKASINDLTAKFKS